VAKMSASSNSNKIKFGTDGWRGIIADDFTFPILGKVTRAIASYLETAYTRDSPVLIAYNAHHLNSAGVLMFTASHNPVRYCGIKYIPDYAWPATPEITDTIVANIESSSDELPSNSRRDLISIFDPKPNYLQFIYTLLDIERIISPNLKVKYDALYSTSCGYLDEVLQHSLWRSVRKFP
jgi:phosphomannomutase